MSFLAAFWLALIIASKYPNSPSSILITRKRIIFPTRITTFFMNIILYTALIDIATSITTTISIVPFAFAILAVIKVIVGLISLTVSINVLPVTWDDPSYYVLI